MVKLSLKNLYIADLFTADIRYSGHFFEQRLNILGKTYMLTADTLWLVGKKENRYMFLIGTFLYFNIKLVI